MSPPTTDEPVLCLDADTYYQPGVVSRWKGDNIERQHSSTT